MAKGLEVIMRVNKEQVERLTALANALSVRRLDLVRVALALGTAQLEELAKDTEGAKRILEAIERVKD